MNQLLSNSNSNDLNWYMFIPKPDRRMPEFKGEYFSMYGWLDVDGAWYSCGFGGHCAKATIIIDSLFELEFDEYTKRKRISRNIQDSFLESKGWVKFHNPHPYKEPYVDIPYNKRLSNIRKNTIVEIQKQFNLGIFNYEMRK
jgi:hypothetical protein